MGNPTGLTINESHFLKNKIGKKFIYIVAGIILLMSVILMVVIYNQDKTGQSESDVDKTDTPAVSTDAPAQLIDNNVGSGIIVPETPHITEDAPVETDKVIQVVVPGPQERQQRVLTDADLNEMQEIRRMRMTNYTKSINSPLLVFNAAKGGTSGTGASSINDIEAAANGVSGLQGPESAIDQEWANPHKRRGGQPYELKTGWLIPAVLLTGINSELRGHIIAQVSQPVYDSATGRHLLIPQGARLFGRYDQGVQYGQSRIFVIWNRLLFPDGSALTLAEMVGSDQSGQSGLTDEVDNHYWRIFASSLLMAGVTGGMAYSVDKLSNQKDGDETTVQGEMGTALASQMGQAGMALLEKNINVSPTLEIRPGYKLNVVVTKDIIFDGPYGSEQ